MQETLQQPEIEAEDIKYVLNDLHQAGLLLVLLMDEFESCVYPDVRRAATTRAFLAGLRSLATHFPRVLSLIVATRPPLSEVCQDVRFMGSPFYNNLEEITPQRARNSSGPGQRR